MRKRASAAELMRAHSLCILRHHRPGRIVRPLLQQHAIDIYQWSQKRYQLMKILCSNGVKSVMLELAPAWERKRGASLTISWGSTLGIMKDINSGAAADLAILTDEAIDELIGSGKAVAGSRVDLARS